MTHLSLQATQKKLRLNLRELLLFRLIFSVKTPRMIGGLIFDRLQKYHKSLRIDTNVFLSYVNNLFSLNQKYLSEDGYSRKCNRTFLARPVLFSSENCIIHGNDSKLMMSSTLLPVIYVRVIINEQLKLQVLPPSSSN